jgi:ATP-binding cassette subfamily B protein
MTKNLPQFKRPYQEGEGYIEIGGQKINDLSTDDLRNTIGIITEENFFFTGTLRENIAWNVPNFDEFQATLFAKELELDRDL